MKVTLKRFTIFSFIILVSGFTMFAIALLSGADPLDGFAGAPTTNTDSQNFLLTVGVYFSFFGLVFTTIGLLIMFMKRLRRVGRAGRSR